MGRENIQLLVKVQQGEDKIITLKKQHDLLQEQLLSSHQSSESLQLENDWLQHQGLKKETDKKMKDWEDQLAMITDQKRDLSAKLYGGEVQNSKELSQLQQKIDDLNKQSDQVEDEVLGLMLKKDELDSSEKQLANQLTEDKQEFERYEKETQLELETLKQEIKKYYTQRVEAIKALPPDLYDRYQRLRKEKGGKAVVGLVGGVCQGCRVSLPTYLVAKVRGNQDLLTCENCGRMLYWIQ